MKVKLRWTTPKTRESQERTYSLPIGIGRDSTAIQSQQGNKTVSKLELYGYDSISRYHVLITESNNNLIIHNKSHSNDIQVNDQTIKTQSRGSLHHGDTIVIEPFRIYCEIVSTAPATPIPANPYDNQAPPTTIIFDPQTDRVTTIQIDRDIYDHDNDFPLPEFSQAEYVNVENLRNTGLPVEDQYKYVALGGGLGSFTWVNHLRIHGVPINKIAVIGLDNKPYGRYQRLCENSQIPPHERLRSGSDSCPDNIWGWPGYAWREAWHNLPLGRFDRSLKCLWQVFAEPLLAETYTPISKNVFKSIDREAKRINWHRMLIQARIRSIRKTDDGRYAIACSILGENYRKHFYVVGKYLHLATGYPAIRFLEDLQNYRSQTSDHQLVVNAYEPHDHIYKRLKHTGGKVIVRGKGIVASRIIQKLTETRGFNEQIEIININRKPTIKGSKFGMARRQVDNHWEFQPFNWPKALWGGELRQRLELANPSEREQYVNTWGGTTTADRKDWKRMIAKGLRGGWYRNLFGNVQNVTLDHSRRKLQISLQTNTEVKNLEADFIIDCTGLESHPKDNPLLEDLIDRYNLPLNSSDRLFVKKDFEMVKMRNPIPQHLRRQNNCEDGRIYASGVLTLGNFYAPVDSFLGLQYSAQRSIESLIKHDAPLLKHLTPVRSLQQWWKWILNKQP